MDEAYEKQAKEWFERGDHDLETAQLLLDERGHIDVIAYHIQQTIEKYLKGFLIIHGEKPPRIHELDVLLGRVLQIAPELSQYIGLCEKASRYYIDSRYPPGPIREYSFDEVKDDLEQTRGLIQMIVRKVEK